MRLADEHPATDSIPDDVALAATCTATLRPSPERP